MSDSSAIVSVKITGYENPVVYTNLVVEQPVLNHHRFSFLWNAGGFKADTNFQLEVLNKYIGQKVTVQFTSSNIFVGLISEIAIDERNNGSQSFIISGYSPSYLLEDSPRSCTFYKKSLQQIADTALKGIQGNILKIKVAAETKDNHHYITQYNETDFQFLSRMAIRYGEWFYYNGNELVFGGAGDSKTTLENGVDLDRLVIKANLMPNKFSYTGYDYFKGEKLSDDMKALEAPSNNSFATETATISKDVFARQNGRTVHVFNVSNKQQLDQFKETDNRRIQSNLVIIKGESRNPGLKTGSRFKVKSHNATSEYIAISVTHSSNVAGHYENTFTAIPASVKAPQYTNPRVIRRSGVQPAVVKENHDTEGMGRIKVQFPWQGGSDMTPWLKIATPHAGGGKGMHFVPEKGEEVIVDFEGGDADKPFVVGALYSGKSKTEYANANNDLKVIQTRSGHVIELNDKDGAESIMIKDKNNNTIIIDTAGNSITMKDKNGNNVMIDAKSNGINITAQGSITLSAMNINLVAGATVNVQATAAYNLNALNSLSNISMNTMVRTKNLTHMVGDILSTSATTINQTAKKDINQKAKGKMIISAEDKLDQHAGEMDVATKKGKLRIKSSSDAEIKGTQVKIN